MSAAAAGVREAEGADAVDLGRMLDAFNREFGDPTPGAEFLATRIGELLERGELLAFLVAVPGEGGPVGFSLTRIRLTLWSQGSEAYLEELYVEPARRGEGLGRALLERTIEAVRERGCDRIELATGETDTEARGLYEKLGFRNTESGPDGPAMLFYEREL